MITLNGIKKYYKMGDNIVRALDGISFEMATGEFVAIVGPSGSGKSTLMNIIGCLDVATEGEYVLNGIPIRNYREAQLADIRNRQIGFVFQQFNLLTHLTAEENVEVPLVYARQPRGRRRECSRALLASVGLGGRVKHKPSELSGGQQQRVSIARALANDPAIILADEPTGALDSKTGEEVLQLLQHLNEGGKTIVMITHDPKIAAHAKRIITLSDGVVVSDTGGGANA
ncbi:MAG: ABC transporter ATP-binding protein [Clostridia bacterium]|nr:ABC transporter ATP-binding protein [Clostridia bacterium]MDR3645069.1 ABC transporter ATP-binding protein [Clostridia bacterium]